MPWPVYKIVALAVALIVLIAVGIATASAAPAVLTAAATGTLVWLGLGLANHSKSWRSRIFFSVARSVFTAAPSAMNSTSLMPGRRRSVNTTSHQSGPAGTAAAG